MGKKILFVWLFVVLTIAAPAVMAADSPALVHVYLLDKSDIQSLNKLHMDVPYVTEDFAEVIAYPEDFAVLDAAGLHYDVIHQDLTAFYQSRNPMNATMGGFLTYSEINDSIDVLHQNFPTLVSARDSIGATWEGRALWVFKISDNVDQDEDEPEIMWNALIHAREPESMEWQMYFINWLLANYGTDDDATEIINEREMWFCLTNNPDGYEYNRQTNPGGGGMWRKNRRSGGGVDLNRNWGYMWGYDNEGSSPYTYDETYRGPSAFSEPETQALRDFIIAHDFKFIMNAHTYGNWFLYPFGYMHIYTPDQDIYSAMGDSAHALNSDYIKGTAWENLYSTNGDALDWQYGDQVTKPLIFCVTTETGSNMDGFWPSTNRIPQLDAGMLPIAKYLALLAANVRAIAAPNPPVLDPIGELDSSSFTVSWTHEDEYNPAVAYELVEKSGYSRVADDLESNTDNWELNGFLLRTSRSHSPSHSLFSGNANNYRGEAVLAEGLSVSAGDTLDFWTWYDIEDDWDYAYVEISTNGGATYTPIAGNITTTYNPHGQNHGNGITGSTNNAWVHAFFPLDDYAGSVVRVKFSYVTDTYTLGQGFFIDDVFPIEGFANNVVLASDITDMSYHIDYRENGTYYYEVRAQDAQDQWSGFSNREEAIIARVGIDDQAQIPTEFNLAQNYPNPFNAQTSIAFALASPGMVKLEVFDITGRLVRKLIDSDMSAGNHSIIWDGKNDSQTVVSTGVYFYKLSTPEKSETRSMMLLK